MFILNSKGNQRKPEVTEPPLFPAWPEAGQQCSRATFRYFDPWYLEMQFTCQLCLFCVCCRPCRWEWSSTEGITTTMTICYAEDWWSCYLPSRSTFKILMPLELEPLINLFFFLAFVLPHLAVLLPEGCVLRWQSLHQQTRLYRTLEWDTCCE